MGYFTKFVVDFDFPIFRTIARVTGPHTIGHTYKSGGVKLNIAEVINLECVFGQDSSKKNVVCTF